MSQYARPYAGGGPLPAGDGNMAIAMYLLDPVTGNPVTPAGTVTGGGTTGLPAGVSASNSVGTSSAVIITAGQYPHWVTIQNTHASQLLYIAFGATATTADFVIVPGAALTLPSGFSNGIAAIGSGAGTTFAIIGY